MTIGSDTHSSGKNDVTVRHLVNCTEYSLTTALDFAQVLLKIPFQFLRKFTMDFKYEALQNHALNPPSALRLADFRHDFLSRALHILSQAPNMTEFCIEAK